MLAFILITLEEKVHFPDIHSNDNLLETCFYLEEQHYCWPAGYAKFNVQSPA